MIAAKGVRVALSAVLVALLVGGLLVATQSSPASETKLTAYFDNTNGIYPGDDVMVLGVPPSPMSGFMNAAICVRIARNSSCMAA